MSIKLLGDHNKVEIKNFPDKTHIIRVESLKLPNEITIKWNYDTDEELFSLIAITRYLQEHGIDKIDLQMPYIPNARFDRVNNPDEVFTLKYFAEVINSLDFNRVYVLDAHSNVSLALINNVKSKWSYQFSVFRKIDYFMRAHSIDTHVNISTLKSPSAFHRFKFKNRGTTKPKLEVDLCS